jgi:hypothetical protein
VRELDHIKVRMPTRAGKQMLWRCLSGPFQGLNSEAGSSAALPIVPRHVLGSVRLYQELYIQHWLHWSPRSSIGPKAKRASLASKSLEINIALPSETNEIPTIAVQRFAGSPPNLPVGS